MIDVAIIGAGPAGLSAAINVYSRNKTAVVFGNKIETSWLYTAEEVNNHLGMPHLSGKEMLEKFVEHAKGLGIEMKEGRVLQILNMGDYFAINFNNENYEAKTIVIATGVSKGKTVAGENDLLGKGVSYCATCDGMLYRGKDVVLIGETEEAEEDADFLAEICSKVYFVPRYKVKGILSHKLTVIDKKVASVLGGDFVEGVSFDDDSSVSCSGAFFIKEAVPIGSLIYGLSLNGNAIEVNRLCETNIAGVYAAGDCTGWPLQLSKAIGEGLVAAQQAVRYLNKKQYGNSVSHV